MSGLIRLHASGEWRRSSRAQHKHARLISGCEDPVLWARVASHGMASQDIDYQHRWSLFQLLGNQLSTLAYRRANACTLILRRDCGSQTGGPSSLKSGGRTTAPRCTSRRRSERGEASVRIASRASAPRWPRKDVSVSAAVRQGRLCFDHSYSARRLHILGRDGAIALDNATVHSKCRVEPISKRLDRAALIGGVGPPLDSSGE